MVLFGCRSLVMVLAAVRACAASQFVEKDGDNFNVGVMVSQVVEEHLPGCHLLIITTTRHSHVTSTILRHFSAVGEAGVVVEVESVITLDQLSQDHHLLQELWGDARTTCRGLILDLTSTNSTNLILGFLELAKLWKLPETVVIAIGGRAGVRSVLLHHNFRNTVNALYLALHDAKFHTPSPHPVSRLEKVLVHEGLTRGRVLVYRRCLYCNNGDADVQFMPKFLYLLGHDTNGLFQDQLENLKGYKFRIVGVPYFPYMDYTVHGEARRGQIIPRDSLDVRLINTFAAVINFTFDIYAEPNRSFGDKKNGSFTGMIGQLQREEVDFSTIVAPTPERLKVVNYLRTYPSDVMAITSLKPALLPAYLSIIRPFTGELWVALLVSVVAWGVTLWLLEKAWQWVAGGRRVALTTALLYGWGALLQNLPSEPSVNLSSQMLVGWWLVFCLVISTGFSSSLVAHLTVQGKSATLDTFQDLVNQGVWKWATEPWLYNGAAYEYFAKHTDPVVNKIYRSMEVMVADDALKNVLAGRFSLIDFKNYISVIVASRYTDALGNTPFYVSNQGISVIAAFGWGLRPGLPVYPRFIQLISGLEDAGIISYWTQDVIAKRVKEKREAAALDPKVDQGNTPLDAEILVALGLHHLQGAFYLLILGCSVAFLTLLGENLAHCCSSPQ